MKYKVVVQQVLDVEAKDEKTARRLVKEDPPFICFYGDDGDVYGVSSRSTVTIVSIERKGNRHEQTD